MILCDVTLVTKSVLIKWHQVSYQLIGVIFHLFQDFFAEEGIEIFFLRPRTREERFFSQMSRHACTRQKNNVLQHLWNYLLQKKFSTASTSNKYRLTTLLLLLTDLNYVTRVLKQVLTKQVSHRQSSFFIPNGLKSWLIPRTSFFF